MMVAAICREAVRQLVALRAPATVPDFIASTPKYD
jgi:hypothetical protein